MRNLHYILAVFLLFCSFATVSAEVVVDGIFYILDKKTYVAPNSVISQIIDAPGEAMVVASSPSYSGDIVIPEKITYEGKEYTVTSIADNTFFKCAITSLTIPSTVESFGVKSIMNCKELQMITCYATTPPEMARQAFQAMDDAVSGMTVIIPAQSFDLYAQHHVWGNIVYDPTRVDYTDEEQHNVVIKTLYTLDDALADFEEKPIIHYEIENGDTLHWHYSNYDSTYNEYNHVSYKRTFRNTNWQALYVPLEFIYDDWKEKFEVASIDGIVEQDADRDGVYDSFYAKATILAEGDSVQPHKLYLIRALEISPEGGDTIVVSKCSRHDVDEDHLYRVYTNVVRDTVMPDGELEFVAEGSGNVYTFRGQYETSYIVEERDAQGNPIQPYCYAMSGGELKRPNPDMTTGVPLGAFRWWLEVTPGPGAASLAASNSRVGFKFGGDGTTSVDEVLINLNEIDGLGIYYDLSGRRVENPGKGIFICNGKKVLLH